MPVVASHTSERERGGGRPAAFPLQKTIAADSDTLKKEVPYAFHALKVYVPAAHGGLNGQSPHLLGAKRAPRTNTHSLTSGFSYLKIMTNADNILLSSRIRRQCYFLFSPLRVCILKAQTHSRHLLIADTCFAARRAQLLIFISLFFRHTMFASSHWCHKYIAYMCRARARDPPTTLSPGWNLSWSRSPSALSRSHDGARLAEFDLRPRFSRAPKKCKLSNEVFWPSAHVKSVHSSSRTSDIRVFIWQLEQ